MDRKIESFKEEKKCDCDLSLYHFILPTLSSWDNLSRFLQHNLSPNPLLSLLSLSLLTHILPVILNLSSLPHFQLTHFLLSPFSLYSGICPRRRLLSWDDRTHRTRIQRPSRSVSREWKCEPQIVPRCVTHTTRSLSLTLFELWAIQMSLRLFSPSKVSSPPPPLSDYFSLNFRPFLGGFNHTRHWRPQSPRCHIWKSTLDFISTPAIQIIFSLISPQNRVAMGSDYPFPLGECVPSESIYPGRLIRQVYDGDENEQVIKFLCICVC